MSSYAEHIRLETRRRVANREHPGTPRSRIRYQEIKAQERDLILAAQDGDRRAAGILVEANEPLIFMIARRYFNRGVDADELMQEGRLGYLHAVRKFDPERGNTMATYAGPWIRHYISEYLLDHCSDVRVSRPVRIAHRRMIRTGKTVDDLIESSDMTDRRLAANFGIVTRPIELDRWVPQSDFEEIAERRDRTLFNLANSVKADELPADELLDELRRSKLRTDLMSRLLQLLPARDREILARRYPADPSAEPESCEQIAASYSHLPNKTRVSRQRISQIELAALQRLRILATRFGFRHPDLT